LDEGSWSSYFRPLLHVAAEGVGPWQKIRIARNSAAGRYRVGKRIRIDGSRSAFNCSAIISVLRAPTSAQ